MTHHIIGYGQIGQSVGKVLGKHSHGDRNDKLLLADIGHVCFPWQPNFVEKVKKIADFYSLTIVHSTVPIGTMDKIDRETLIYSPVRGKHPNLVPGIKTFTKYFAGVEEFCKYVMKEFRKNGVKCEFTSSYKELEAAKLLDTTYYGWNIIFAKEVKKFCDRNKLDFKLVYTKWNKTYNKGYTELGIENVVRPVLQPKDGRIGGHCVSENSEILKNIFSPAMYITKHNK